MIDDLNAIILKPVAIICSLSVAWVFSYGVYQSGLPSLETKPVSIVISENSNLLPEQIMEVTIEPSPIEVNHAVDSSEISLDLATIDRELVLTPSPIPQTTPLPSPLPTLKPKTTPAPTNAPIAPQVITNFEPLFEQWSKHFGVDITLLKHIARCESRFNPAAVGGIYGGMYQFSASTWKSTRAVMEHDPDPTLRFDANEAIKTAAFKIASGGQSAWKNCLPR